jgi:hypothetical protein
LGHPDPLFKGAQPRLQAIDAVVVHQKPSQTQAAGE